MPLSTGKTYLEQFADDPVAQRALLACAAALRLDDESASSAIEIVAQANGRTRELLHTVKNLGCVWRQWDGSWYLAEDVRKELVGELHRSIPTEQVSKLRSQLADRADQRAAAMPPDGQITAHQLRIALFEAGFQRTMVSEQSEKGGEQLGAIWENAAPAAGEATARTVDYLAPEIEERIGQLPVQVLFLRGMAARARHDRDSQEKYFRAVWKQGRPGYIFGAAAHLYGNLVRDRATAERALNDSLRWQPLLIHKGHVLHSLGKLLAKDRKRSQEAEKAYRKSLELDPSALQAGQVWHSLGNLLTNDRHRWQEAEDAYNKSLALRPGQVADEAHVNASLANLLAKYHQPEADDRAEQLALRSLELDRGNPWTNGVCYRVLADVYERRSDFPNAINALKSLLETDRRLGKHKFQQSITDRIAALSCGELPPHRKVKAPPLPSPVEEDDEFAEEAEPLTADLPTRPKLAGLLPPATETEQKPFRFHSPHEQRIQEGIERVLKEAWESVPDETLPENRFKVARAQASDIAGRLSPNIKREVRKHFETQKWEQLRVRDPKL
jgi:tetratricopeptide (TPR) repeat protein